MADREIELGLFHQPGYKPVDPSELDGLEMYQVAYKIKSGAWAILPKVGPLVTSANFGKLLLQGAKEAAEHAKQVRDDGPQAA